MNYKEILKGIVNIINTTEKSDIGFANICSYIGENCPELKESEDERIRKDIMVLVKDWWDRVNKDNISTKEQMLAWLERQGKSIRIKKGKNYLCTKTHKYAGLEWIEGVKYYSPEDYALVNQGCTCHCPEYSKEKHNNFFKEVEYDGCVEVDNVKPKFIKFNVGDWIACEELNTAKIISFDSDRYIVEFIDGSRGLPHIDYVDRHFHLWSIADAKEGDVLEFEDHKRVVVGIVSFVNERTGRVDMSCLLEDNEFKIGTFYALDTIKPHPATKEQRNLLFTKMREAGYEWTVLSPYLSKMSMS